MIAYSVGIFVIGDIKQYEKQSLVITVLLLISVCVPVFILNFSRLRSLKKLMKELEELTGALNDDEDEEESDDSSEADDVIMEEDENGMIKFKKQSGLTS